MNEAHNKVGTIGLDVKAMNNFVNLCPSKIGKVQKTFPKFLWKYDFLIYFFESIN